MARQKTLSSIVRYIPVDGEQDWGGEVTNILDDLIDAAEVSYRRTNPLGFEFQEAAAGGTNKITMKAPAALAADYTLTLPTTDGTSSQVLQTNGSGVLSWADMATSLGLFNVTDYGAVGDGVTDDATAIQAAITAADSAGGGTIYFPPSVYLIGSALTLPKQIAMGSYYRVPDCAIIFQGAGKNTTQLKTTAASNMLGWEAGTAPAWFACRDMTLHSDTAGGTVMVKTGSDTELDRLYLYMDNVDVDYTGMATDTTDTGLAWARSGGGPYTITVTHSSHGFSTSNEILFSSCSSTTNRFNGLHTITRVDDNSYTFSVTADPGASGTVSAGKPYFAINVWGLLYSRLCNVNFLGGAGSGNNSPAYGMLADYHSHTVLENVFAGSGSNGCALYLRNGGNNTIIHTRLDSGTRDGWPSFVLDDVHNYTIIGLYSEGKDDNPVLLVKDSWAVQIHNIDGASNDTVTHPGSGDYNIVEIQQSKGIDFYGGKLSDQNTLTGSGKAFVVDAGSDIIHMYGVRMIDALNNITLPASYTDILLDIYSAASESALPTTRHVYGHQLQTVLATTDAVSWTTGIGAIGYPIQLGVGNGTITIRNQLDAGIPLSIRATASQSGDLISCKASDATTDLFRVINTGSMALTGTWNGPHIIMGGFHLWVSAAGKLYIKNGVPANETDGDVVGTQS